MSMYDYPAAADGQRLSTTDAVLKPRHVLRSNGVYSSGGRIERYRSDGQSYFACDGADQLNTSLHHAVTTLDSPYFAFTSTPAASTPYNHDNNALPGFQVLSDADFRRQRCQSATSSQQSSQSAPSEPSLQFSIDAMRAAAMKLRRQEEVWQDGWPPLHAETLQNHSTFPTDNVQRKEHSVASSSMQVPIHHPSFDLDEFINSHHHLGKVETHTAQQGSASANGGQEGTDKLQKQQQQSVAWSNVSNTDVAASPWLPQETTQQILGSNTGSVVCEQTQRELEMLLRQDLAWKMNEVTAVCEQDGSPERAENKFGEQVSLDDANWTLPQQAAHARNAASYSAQNHVIKLPFLTETQSTTPSGSPPLAIKAAASHSKPCARPAKKRQASAIPTSAAQAKKTAVKLNTAANKASKATPAKTASPVPTIGGTADDTSTSASAAESAKSFAMAQEKRTGDLAWITGMNGGSLEAGRKYPIRPLMNGVLAQLHNEWLGKHPTVHFNRAADEASKTVGASQEGTSHSLTGNFPVVEPSKESMQIRTMWRDLEKRRQLGVCDEETLAELRQRAEVHLRVEASERAGLPAMPVEVLMAVTAAPSAQDVTERALAMWERACTTAAYSVGLLRQAEYCLAQSAICFAPKEAPVRKAAKPRKRQGKEEGKDGKEGQHASDEVNKRASKRKRASQESAGSVSINASNVSFCTTAAAAAATSCASESGSAQATPLDGTPLGEAMLRLQERSLQAMPQ